MKIKETMKIEELLPLIFNLDKEKVYDVLIKEHKEKRSLNANSYAWTLITKIADRLRMSKEEVYETMLERYGQSEVVSVLSNIDVKGYFKYYREFGKGFVNGKEFTHYKIMKGSSNYDTLEMSILIDGIVQECEMLGIETMTPNQLEELKSLWRSETKA